MPTNVKGGGLCPVVSLYVVVRPSLHSPPVVTSFGPISFRPISVAAAAEFIAWKSALHPPESVTLRPTVGPIREKWEGRRHRKREIVVSVELCVPTRCGIRHI